MTPPLKGDRLVSIRAEAWSQIPALATLRATLTWKRQGYTPTWITNKVESHPRKQPGFDIIGGMAFYAVDSFLAQKAPKHVLETIYAAMFAHTARYCLSSKRRIDENGNGLITELPSWPRTLEITAKWGFSVEHMHKWIEANKGN